MSIFSYLMALPEVQQIVLGHCPCVFIFDNLKISLIDVNCIPINIFVKTELNIIPKESDRKQILFISLFN